MGKLKTFYVTVELKVYAETDDEARKRAHDELDFLVTGGRIVAGFIIGDSEESHA